MESTTQVQFLTTTADEEKAQRLKEARARNRGKPTPCPMCGMIISNTYNLNCHMRRHKNDKPFKCDQCPLSFILMQELKRHKITHATERPFKCKVCPKNFKSIEMLRTHMDSHGCNEYKCRYCDEKFKKYKGRATHEMRYHLKSDLKCKYCYKSFVEVKFKDQHEQTVHKKLLESSQNDKRVKMESSDLTGKEPNTVSLDDIAKRPNKRKMNKKRDVDGEFKYYACKFCPVRFKFRKDQVTHYQEKHKEDYDKVFSQCKICGKLLTAAHFKSHMMAHEGVFKHKCGICDYKSARLTDLKCHMVVHIKDNKYSCVICNKPFRTQKSAVVCEQRHSGTKDEKCNFCERTFFSNLDLKNHIVYQHKDRKCPYCDFETDNRCLYDRHKREHRKDYTLKRAKNESKYMCEICGRMFSNHAYMINHMKVHEELKDVNAQSKEYFCYYCIYKGSSTSDILNHSISEHPGKVKYCAFCTYATLNGTVFKNHLKHHVNGSSKDFYLYSSLNKKEELERKCKIMECFICGFNTNSVAEFEAHVKLHNQSLNDFEWYLLDFFYCTLRERNSDIKGKEIKEILKTFPPNNITFVDIKDRSLPVDIYEVVNEFNSGIKDEDTFDYDFPDSYNSYSEDINFKNEDCDKVSQSSGDSRIIENFRDVKVEKEEFEMNSNSFIEIDAEMNYCAENMNDNSHSPKKCNPIIKINSVIEDENDDKIIEINDESFQNVADKTKTPESKLEMLTHKIESLCTNKAKGSKIIFNMDVLKNKLQNINGKLFLSFEDLCSVSNIKKERIGDR